MRSLLDHRAVVNVQAKVCQRTGHLHLAMARELVLSKGNVCGEGSRQQLVARRLRGVLPCSLRCAEAGHLLLRE